MKITEVRIKLMEDSSDRLRGFCSITFDDAFVIRDLKIIEGANGPFVAMPSRKLTGHCPNCGCKNHLRAGYCNQCGMKLKQPHVERGSDQRAKLYADIAHPINSECREQIQTRVIDEYHNEIEEAKRPGYRSKYDDYFTDAGEDYEHDDDHDSNSSNKDSMRQETTSESIERSEDSSKLKGPHSRSADASIHSDASRPRKFGEGIFDD
ncbi:stage V sporulation protein G [Bremerella cremea]|uniref:Stage V sporulation protein G n=1 Tax=Blastopirellula marina TaxID=124 RepID=A0A2S8G529_9BACT|nr:MULTISPECIES: SpoVG family protein [Pirellulaceae]PQO39559.1 stage V sporulation protein G [Blastopirellula marina]RCS51026.1 stage V sporulation protein G [Bremerella cremea]